MTNSKIKAWLDNRDSQPVQLSFSKYWSEMLYLSQTMTHHGVIFPKVCLIIVIINLLCNSVCNEYCSDTLYPCQIFSKVPFMISNDTNTSLIWTIAELICRVKKLWKIVTQAELRTSKWHGWMLTYMTKHCFNEGNR
jgi:hypothetical protein